MAACPRHASFILRGRLNRLIRGVTRGKRLAVLGGQKRPSPSRCATSRGVAVCGRRRGLLTSPQVRSAGVPDSWNWHSGSPLPERAEARMP
jgi:hypothetical protein